jgi:hypothetical protein
MPTPILTQTQRDCLDYLDRHNLGAILFEGSWRFREAFRQDAVMAERFAVKMIRYPDSSAELQGAGLSES